MNMKSVYSDLFSRYGNISFMGAVLRSMAIPCCKIIVSLRTVQSLKMKRMLRPLYLFMRLRHRCLEYKYSIGLPEDVSIGQGIFFPHGGPFVISGGARIGEKCTIHPNALIGSVRGKGDPTIGDNVFIGNGAKIIGNCTVGEWVFINPGAVITKDVPSYSVVGSGYNNIIGRDGKRCVELYFH